MRQSEYLYGCTPDEFAVVTIIQQKLYESKIQQAYELITLLHQEDLMTRDFDRIRQAHKAIKFNEKLLEELL